MKNVAPKKIKQNDSVNSKKEEAIREFILLCCVLFFAFQVYSSFFLSAKNSSSVFSLQSDSQNGLALVKSRAPSSTTENSGEGTQLFAPLTPFFFAPIPVNYCDTKLLQSVSGIGPGLAESIMQTRERLGFFRDEKDLLHVSGIGESRMNRFSKKFSFEIHN